MTPVGDEMIEVDIADSIEVVLNCRGSIGVEKTTEPDKAKTMPIFNMLGM